MGLIEKRRSGFAGPEKPLGEVRVFSLVFEMFHGQKNEGCSDAENGRHGFLQEGEEGERRGQRRTFSAYLS